MEPCVKSAQREMAWIHGLGVFATKSSMMRVMPTIVRSEYCTGVMSFEGVAINVLSYVL